MTFSQPTRTGINIRYYFFFPFRTRVNEWWMNPWYLSRRRRRSRRRIRIKALRSLAWYRMKISFVVCILIPCRVHGTLFDIVNFHVHTYSDQDSVSSQNVRWTRRGNKKYETLFRHFWCLEWPSLYDVQNSLTTCDNMRHFWNIWIAFSEANMQKHQRHIFCCLCYAEFVII